MGISIRVVLIAMMIVLAVISAVIIGTLIYDAGIKSVHKSTEALRAELVGRKQLEIGNFFRAPMNVLLNLQAASRILGTFDYRNPDTFDYWLCSMLRINANLPTYFGTEEGRFTYTTRNDAGQCTLSKTFAPGVATTTWMNYSADGIPFYAAPPRGANRSTTYDPRTRPWYATAANGPAWSDVYLNFNSILSAVTPVSPMYDPVQQRNVGTFATDFLTDQLLKYLSSIEVGKTGKIILVEKKTRNVIGLSWDEPAVFNITRNDGGPFRNQTWFDLRMARLDNYTEPLLKGAVDSLGIDTLYDCNDNRNASSRDVYCKRTFGAGRDRVFLDVVAIQDSFGLDLRLIVLMPEADFLEDMWKRSDVAIGAAIGAVIAVIVLATVVVYFVLKPLQRVEERLYQTATLEDTEDDDALSIFSEVARIQEAYAKMVAELKRIRSYVPQSLLRTLDNVVGDEDEEESDAATMEKSVISSENKDASSRAKSNTSKRPPSDGDRSHRSKRSSNNSTASKAALAAGRQLNTAVGLASRRVTVLVVNLAGFHALAKSLTPDKLLAEHADAMKHINAVVSANKGVFDFFSGDHFTVTFNAVTNCASHVTRAAAAILQIGAKVKSANFGAASGAVLCGNMGIDEIKRFSIVGPAVNQAHVMERLCKVLGVKSLVTWSCYESMQFEYHLQCVDVVQLPFTKAPTPVATVVGSKGGAAADEWMYVLAKSDESASSFATLNEGYVKVVQGDAEGARALLPKLPAELPGTARLRELVNVPLDEVARSLGRYYTAALVDGQQQAVPQQSKP